MSDEVKSEETLTPVRYRVQTSAEHSPSHAADRLRSVASELRKSGSKARRESADNLIGGVIAGDCLWRDELKEELARVKRHVADVARMSGNVIESFRNPTADECIALALKFDALCHENSLLPEKPNEL